MRRLRFTWLATITLIGFTGARAQPATTEIDVATTIDSSSQILLLDRCQKSGQPRRMPAPISSAQKSPPSGGNTKSMADMP